MSDVKVMKETKEIKPGLWRSFLNWLDGDRAPKVDERIRVELPMGNTDIFLSSKQRKRLEDAMEAPSNPEGHTAFYSRETGFWTRSSGQKGGDSSVII